MTARPTLVVLALAASGAAALHFAGPRAPAGPYAPASLGALVAFLAVGRLLRDLRARDRLSISAGAGALGFLVGAVSGVGPVPASLSFAGAFLPALALLLAGVGRERVAFELSRLEDAVEDPAARSQAVARAMAIRDEARAAARARDPEARGAPEHAGDPRGVYAYAAEVVAYGRARGGDHAGAVASLDEVPVRWMPAAMRPLMIGNLAFFHLCLGAPVAALAALDRLPEKDAAADHRAVLRAARAAALARLDRGQEALALVGRSDEESLPPDRLKARFAVVRAMALLALGDREGAARELGRARRMDGGPAEVARFRPALGERAGALVDEGGEE